MRKAILTSIGILSLVLVIACSSGGRAAPEQLTPVPGPTAAPAAAPVASGQPTPAQGQAEAPASGDTGQSTPAQEQPAAAAPDAEASAGASVEAQAPLAGERATDADAETLAQSEGSFPSRGDGQPGGGSADTQAATDSSSREEQMVDVQVGQQYQAGTRVNFPSVGISFVIPPEWLGAIPQGSSFFVMGSNSQPGLAVVTSHQANSNNELVSYLSQPLPLDENLFLEVVGQPQVEGPWISASVSTSDGVTTYGGYLMALVRQQGAGILMVAIGPRERTEYYRRLVEEVASSVSETAVASTAGQGASGGEASGASSALVQEWDQWLRGKRLTYLTSYSSGPSGGYSTHYEFDFCSDGSFVYYDRSHVSIDTGGAFGYSGGTTSDTDQWRIAAQGGQIVAELRWQDGQTGQHLLEYVDNKTYIDGQRWFVTNDNASCP